jgi:hypothetical protein
MPNLRLGLPAVVLMAAAAWAQQDDFYTPGKRVYAETPWGALHGKARVVAVRGDQIEVEFFKYDKLESLESLIDMGRPTERATISRQQLDWWNRGRYEIFVQDGGRLWPKAMVVGQNGDTFDVQVFDNDGNPSKRIQVPRNDILRYNVPVYPKQGESVGGITMDYADPDAQAAIDKLRAVVEKHRAAVENAPSLARRVDAQKELAYELFVEYKKLGIEHDGNFVPSDTPTASERRSMAMKDAKPNSLGSYLRSKVGVCSEQAAVYLGLMAKSGAPELGLHFQRISTYHSEVYARFADGSHWVQDMTGARGVPVPGRNFAGLSETAGKPPEVGWHKGKSGLGLVNSVSVDTTFDPAKHEMPPRLALTNTDRIVTDLTPNGGAFDRARAGAAVKREAAGAATFAAAWLVKEGFKAVESGDPEQIKAAAAQMMTGRFWGDLAVFTVAARVVEKLPLGGGLARMALPLAAGMAAVQVLHGEASLRDILIDTGSFVAVGAAVSLIADSLIYPALFAAGPPGWVAAGVYTVAKLAVTLYGGEKLGDWIRGMFAPRSVERQTSGREGVTEKLKRVGE